MTSWLLDWYPRTAGEAIACCVIAAGIIVGVMA